MTTRGHAILTKPGQHQKICTISMCTCDCQSRLDVSNLSQVSFVLVVPPFYTIAIVFLSPCQNCDICEIWTRVWNPVKIVKYCKNCGIWSILRHMFKIEKSGQNCEFPHWQFPLELYLRWVCLIFLFISEIIKNMFVFICFCQHFLFNRPT